MEMNQKTEKILSSLEGMSRAEASPFLFTRIMQKLEQKTEVYSGIKVSLRTVYFSLSGLALLLFLNFYSITKTNTETSGNNLQDVADSYGLNNENGFYY